MKYFVELEGQEIEVDLQSAGGGFTVRVEGRTYTVDAASVEDGERYSLLIDGRSADVAVDADGSQLSLILGGRQYTLRAENVRERAARQIAGKGPASGEIVVSSRMPGIVQGVLVRVGQAVRAGEPLVILEAMKMENELAAETDGVVTRVHVEEGQTVNGGDPLVVLGPPAGGG